MRKGVIRSGLGSGRSVTQLALATLRAAEMVRTLGGQGGNPLKALVAYFEPIMQDLDGTLFDPTVFADRVRAAYGWNFNHEAAEGFRYTFRTLKLLEPCRDGMGNPISEDGVPVDRVTASRTTNVESQREFERKIERIVAAFRDFVTKILPGRASYARSDDQIIDNLLSWILDLFNEGTAETEIEEAKEAENPTKDQDRYLVARFVSSSLKEGGDLANDLETIYLVGLVADLADEFKAPFRKTERTGVTVFLDSPVALDLLGTSGTIAAESARSIVSKLQSMGAKIEVLSQTRQELINTMFAVVKSETDARTGPTGEALMTGEVAEAYLWSIINDADNVLREFKVTVRSRMVDENAGSARSFTQNDYDQLYQEYFSRYPPMTVPSTRAKYERRCHHDTHAAKIVCRLRADDVHSDIFESRTFFLTRNRSFAVIAKNFCVRKEIIDDSCVGPFVTMHELAASLWLRTGMGAQNDMPRRQLLTSCARVLARNERVVGKARRAILSLRSNPSVDAERVRQLEAIIMQDRSMLMVSDRVRGAMESFGVDDINAVVQEYAKVEQTKGFTLAQSEVQAEYESLRAENVRLLDENVDLTASVDNITGVLRQTEEVNNERFNSLDVRIKEIESKDHDHFVKLIERVNGEVSSRRRAIQIVGILLVASLSALAAWKEVAFPLGLVDEPPTNKLNPLGWASVIAAIALSSGFLLGDLFLRTIGAEMRLDNLLFERWAMKRITLVAEDHEVSAYLEAHELRYERGKLAIDTALVPKT